MKARCVQCGRMWGISLYQAIPRAGYLCPGCTALRRQKRSPAGKRSQQGSTNLHKQYNANQPKKQGGGADGSHRP